MASVASSNKRKRTNNHVLPVQATAMAARAAAAVKTAKIQAQPHHRYHRNQEHVKAFLAQQPQQRQLQQQQQQPSDPVSGVYGVSPAQLEFIRKTRRAIDDGRISLCGPDSNWSCIRPTFVDDVVTSSSGLCGGEEEKEEEGGGKQQQQQEQRRRRRQLTGAYYVKPVAVWLPHLIIPGHVPYCPHCGSNEDVDLNKNNRWSKSLRVISGLNSYRYLDTKYYWCTRCKRCFIGTNPQSMTLGNSRLLGRFTFYLPRNTQANAMDEELYQFIVSAQTRTKPELIVNKLHTLVKEQYNQDLMRYLLDVRDGRVYPKNHHIIEQQEQFANQIIKRKRKKRSYEDHEKFPTLEKLRIDEAKAKEKANDDVCLQQLLLLKTNRNYIDLDLKCLGQSKLIKILECGITTARHLIQCATSPFDERYKQLRVKAGSRPQIVEGWIKRIREDFQQREETYQQLTTQVRQLEEELGVPQEEAQIQQQEEAEEKARASVLLATTGRAEPPQPESPQYANFSSIEDKDGYNARFVTVKMVKHVLGEHFVSQQRYEYLGRMVKLGGEFLRLHFLDEIGLRIFTSTTTHPNYNNGPNSPGGPNYTTKHFPYQSLAVILNEKGLVIWWGMIRKQQQSSQYYHLEGEEEKKEAMPSSPPTSSSSVEEIFAPLQKLKSRLDRWGCTVNSIYAHDFTICMRLQEIFGVVRFDVFDWIRRWNIILVNPTLNRSDMFRALLAKAVLGISLNDFRQGKRAVKARLKTNTTTTDREPTVKEVLRECYNADLPSPEKQEEGVMNVIYYFYQLDIQVEATESGRNGGNAGGGDVEETATKRQYPSKRMFNDYNLVTKVVEEQLLVIRKSKLSDQESATAREEIRQLSEQLKKEVFPTSGPGSGVRRAERIIWSVLDERNSKLMEELDLPRPLSRDSPSDMESEAAAIAASMGMEEPQFQVLDCKQATTTSSETENLGFDIGLDGIEDEDVNNDDYLHNVLVDREEQVKEAEETAPDATVMEDGSDDYNDVPVKADAVAVDDTDDTPMILEHISKLISRNARQLESFLTEREGLKKESCLEAFHKLAESEHWAQFLQCKPFGGWEDKSVEAEELTVFEQIDRRNAFDDTSLSSYDQFEKAWNFEAGRRLKSRCNGGKDILIFRKSAKDLLEQHDFLAAKQKHAIECLKEKEHNTYCSTCGFRRKQHAFFESFGKKCKKGYCGRCGATEFWHTEYGSKMGFQCQLTAAQTGLGENKIQRFDEVWRNRIDLDQTTREELIQTYTPISTILLRQPVPEHTVLPKQEDLTEQLAFLKLRNEAFSTALLRAVEDRFILKGGEKVFSPLKLWVKDEREKPQHKLTAQQWGRVNEWCKLYYAIKCYHVREFDTKDQHALSSELSKVKEKPSSRLQLSWLDIAIEVANAEDLDLKIKELVPAELRTRELDNQADLAKKGVEDEAMQEKSVQQPAPHANLRQHPFQHQQHQPAEPLLNPTQYWYCYNQLIAGKARGAATLGETAPGLSGQLTAQEDSVAPPPAVAVATTTTNSVVVTAGENQKNEGAPRNPKESFQDIEEQTINKEDSGEDEESATSAKDELLAIENQTVEKEDSGEQHEATAKDRDSLNAIQDQTKETETMQEEEQVENVLPEDETNAGTAETEDSEEQEQPQHQQSPVQAGNSFQAFPNQQTNQLGLNASIMPYQYYNPYTHMPSYAHMQSYYLAAYAGAMTPTMPMAVHGAGVAGVATQRVSQGQGEPKPRNQKKQRREPPKPPPKKHKKRRQKQPKPPEKFNRRKYCHICGFGKKEHAYNELEEGICSRNWCRRCGERKEFHTDCPMGPLCTKDRNGNTDPSDWWHKGFRG